MNYIGLTRRSFILGLSALGLTGCGWHLRGKQNVPFKTIYIALGENSAVRATIRRNLEAHKQTILLLNRRGYQTVAQCEDCREVLKCPKCSVPMVYHKASHKLLCHYCGLSLIHI